MVPDSVGRDVVDGGFVPRQHRVVVAAVTGGEELVEDVLCLVEGHRAHAKQREAATTAEDSGEDLIQKPIN